MQSTFDIFRSKHDYDFRTLVLERELAQYVTADEAFGLLVDNFGRLFPGGAVFSEEMGGYKLTAITSIGWDGFPVSIVETGPTHMTLETEEDHLLRGRAIHQIVLLGDQLYYRVEGHDAGMGGLGLIHAMNNRLAYIMWRRLGSRIASMLRAYAQNTRASSQSNARANAVPEDTQ